MSNNFDTIKFISKLNRETSEGKQLWMRATVVAPQALSDTQQLQGFCYGTKLLNRFLRVYRYSYRYYIDEDSYSTMHSIRLEFFDEKTGNTEWAFPEERITEDLYETVSFKTANLKGIFDEYLKDDSEDEPVF